MAQDRYYQERAIRDILERHFSCTDADKEAWNAETAKKMPLPTKEEQRLFQEYEKLVSKSRELESKLFGKVYTANLQNTKEVSPAVLLTKSQQAFRQERQRLWDAREDQATKFWRDYQIDLILTFSNTKALAAIQQVLQELPIALKE